MSDCCFSAVYQGLSYISFPIFRNQSSEGKAMNNYSPIQSDLFAQSFVSTQATTNKPPVTTSVPTLVAYATKIAERVWLKDHTRTFNMRGIRWFADYKDFGQLTLADVRRKHIYDFVDHLIETRGISKNTANKYMAGISRVMSYANDKDVVDNPIKLKYETIKAGRPRYFTHDEQRELVAYLRDVVKKPWMADLVILSCNTGMRLGECRAITKPIVELSDCGEWLYLPEEVCKSGEREVPLNAEARAAYERLLPVIDKAFSHRTFYRNWNKARRDVGKGDPLWLFHVCRHTAASRLSNNVGANEFEIADILGHADTRTTRRYVHTRKNNLLNAVRAL